MKIIENNFAFNNPANLNDVNGADPLSSSYKPILSHWSADFDENYQGADYGAARAAAKQRYYDQMYGVPYVGGISETYVGHLDLNFTVGGPMSGTPMIWNPWADNPNGGTGDWIPLMSSDGQSFYNKKFGTDSRVVLYNEDQTQSDPYVKKTQKFRLDAGLGVTGGDNEGRVSTGTVASYSMDLTVSVFKAGVFDRNGNFSFVWRAKISAVSFVSATSGDLITKGSVALVSDGTILGEYTLMPPSGPIIPTFSGQYSYVGERYIDLPNSYGNVQIQFLGTWMIDNMGQRQVPASLTQPGGLSVLQTVILH